jgi:hypothetical protein
MVRIPSLPRGRWHFAWCTDDSSAPERTLRRSPWGLLGPGEFGSNAAAPLNWRTRSRRPLLDQEELSLTALTEATFAKSADGLGPGKGTLPSILTQPFAGP